MSAGTTPFALIVSRNTSDAESLQSYFQLCRVEAVICSRMDARGDFRRPTTVVVFPDEFSALSADGVRRLARRFSYATVIIVTFALAFYEGLTRKLEQRPSGQVFVLPLPIWGWALIDRVLASNRPTQACQTLPTF